MKNSHRPAAKFTVATIAVLLAAFAGNTFAAETTWQKNHPRRTEVNGRLAKQNARIHQEVKSGQINKTQAAALHQEDHTVRTEERGMASQDGSHITKVDKAALNQQENGISKQIGK